MGVDKKIIVDYKKDNEREDFDVGIIDVVSFIATISLEDTVADFSIEDKYTGKLRRGDFFRGNKLDITAIAPDIPTSLNEWSFDADVSVALSGFSLDCNLVRSLICALI